MKHFNVMIALIVAVTVGTVALCAAPMHAAALPWKAAVIADAKGDACAGIGLAGASCSGNSSATKANSFLTTLINLISLVVGVIAVVMIILAGAKFISSDGDTGKIANAKTSIIYAIIGLVVVAAAQAIVRFVLTNAKV